MGCGASSEQQPVAGQSRVVLVQPPPQPQPQPADGTTPSASSLTPSALRQLPQVEGVHVAGTNPLGVARLPQFRLRPDDGSDDASEHRPAEAVAAATPAEPSAVGPVERMETFLRGLGVSDAAVAGNAAATVANGIETPAQFELLGREQLRGLAFKEDDIDRILHEIKSRAEQDQERLNQAIAESLRYKETEREASDPQWNKWEEDLAKALSLSLSSDTDSNRAAVRQSLLEQQELQRVLELSALEALEHEDANTTAATRQQRSEVDFLYEPEEEQPVLPVPEAGTKASLRSPEPEPEKEPPPPPTPGKPAASQSLHAQLLQSLESMNVGELRQRAEQEGVDPAKIEAARDSRDPKAELSTLIVCSIVASLRRGEQDASAVGGGANDNDTSPEERLRTELEALDVGQLRRRAQATGVAKDRIEAARDSHNPTRELMTLLLEQAAEHRAAGVDIIEMTQQRLDRLRVELAGLDINALCQHAKQEGAEARLVDDARMRIDVAPKEALVALIVAKCGQTMGLETGLQPGAIGSVRPPPPPPRPSPGNGRKAAIATATAAPPGTPPPRGGGGGGGGGARPAYAPLTQRALGIDGDAAGPGDAGKTPLPAPAFQGP
jgi:hypothetical protein